MQDIRGKVLGAMVCGREGKWALRPNHSQSPVLNQPGRAPESLITKMCTADSVVTPDGCVVVGLELSCLSLQPSPGFCASIRPLFMKHSAEKVTERVGK